MARSATSSKSMTWVPNYVQDAPPQIWRGQAVYLPRTEGGGGLVQLELPARRPLSVLINNSRRRRTLSSTLSKTTMTGNPCTPSADIQWNSVGNWECLQYYLQRMRRTPPMLAEQRSRPKVQVGIKSAPRQIPTAGETGWRGPRQDPQMAKNSWPKGWKRGLYIAPQDQSLPTRWHQHNILKKPDVDPKYRLCGRFDETIDHLVSRLPALTRRLHTCTGRSAKTLVLRWRKDGMSMNPRLSPRRIASPFCVTYTHTHWEDHPRTLC